MQAKDGIGAAKNLYDYWGERLYRSVIDDSRVIINLASKEYSKCIEKYLAIIALNKSIIYIRIQIPKQQESDRSCLHHLIIQTVAQMCIRDSSCFLDVHLSSTKYLCQGCQTE